MDLQHGRQNFEESGVQESGVQEFWRIVAWEFGKCECDVARASSPDPPSRSEKELACLRRASEGFAVPVTPLFRRGGLAK